MGLFDRFKENRPSSIRQCAISVPEPSASMQDAKQLTYSDKKALAESRKMMKKVLSSAKQLNTDLLEMSSHRDTCEECAKYQGRVYSISGSDPRFPKLPIYILENGRVHPGCRHTFFPYVFGCPLTVPGEDPLAYSNRPFCDTRTEADRAAYLEWEQKYQLMCKKENFAAIASREILKIIRKEPGILQTDLAKRFEPDVRSVINATLAKLEKSEKITREKTGKTFSLRLNQPK